MQGNGSAGTAASAGQVREQILIVLQAWGMEPDLAAITAGLMAETDLLGIDSHGISMLPSYEEKLRAGTLRLDARPRLVRDGGASALLDGMGGLGYPVSAQAMNLAVDKALEHGVGAVSVCNSHHFGAAGVYARIAVERGVVGLVTSSANGVIMVPTRGAMPMLGTNPIAFGWPRPGAQPYVFDFATSAVARGDMSLHDIAGKPIPEGWGVDAEGRPTTSARAALDGAMLTFGGHKGSALSTMIELMAGPLIGDLTSRESMAFDDGAKAAPMHGELILAFDPAVMGGGDAEANAARAEALFAAFADQGSRLPSQRRYEARARSLERGVRTPKVLYDQIMALGF